MNPQQRTTWLRDSLDMAFQALAASPELRSALVYKGARILALRLGGEHRASYDLDANLLHTFTREFPDPDRLLTVLEERFDRALRAYAEAQDPVRYEIEQVQIVRRPRRDHPLGWNAYDVSVRLRDLRHEGVRGLPTLTFDIAAPETLGDHAIKPLMVGDETVFAYTLERIAGEKMRAFLSSLPTYRTKVQKPGESVRVKDLYDVTKILQVRPLTDLDFWLCAAEEFRLACASRYIDCRGLATFAEAIDVTRATYDIETTLPKDVGFETAWLAITAIVAFWERHEILPFEFPLPNGQLSETDA